MSTTFSLEGVCKLRDCPASDALEDAAREYAALADEYGPRNVLVLKRHPAGLEAVRERLAAVDSTNGSPRSPRVESVPEHASKVIEEHDPTLDRLEYEERIELISLVIDGASRDVPDYLERAARHESFARDVGQLLLEATRQQRRLEDGADVHDCLEFLYAMNDRFHEAIASRGYVERADVIPRAVDLLEDDADGLRTRMTESFDAVLALEFEEFRRLDRRYLGALSADARLVCLGERHASVERTRVEPGRIGDVVGDGLAMERLERVDASGSPHRDIVRFLATGDAPESKESTDAQASEGDSSVDAAEPTGRAHRIRTGTAREQVRAVATEIQSLSGRREWGYDEFVVAVPSIERVPDTRRRLREAGVPTATIGTPSLAEDPAVNELYAFVALQCERSETRAADGDRDGDFAREDGLERLRARVDDFSPSLLEACDDSSVVRALRQWLRQTNLKGRIAAEEDWVDAREQYAGVRRVLEIADFVEETDLVGPDWHGFRRMLERTIRYDAPYVHAVETQPPTGGVTVCAVGDLKYDAYEVVFLLDLIDDAYPGEQFLTQLFPDAWLEEMSGYPAVTDPSPETVAETFATVDGSDDVGDPFETYHAQRSRRRLAIGARAARSRLYCCSYERGSGGLRRTYDESRYLQLLASTSGPTLEDVDTHDEAAINGETNALEAVLDQPHGELERVLREASTGGEADLADTEELFEELAVVLSADDVDDELAEAVRSQFEFAAGEVVRND
ncbi:PD-(D/E)XK nuclease family protein [Natronobacterium gregoryi]|uniref:Superfamily I DNA or RNA helicase n=2 Tax=Natronobacterium gregoryi TaxID=44930 RepID=L0ALJ9_NATGS|nr:hypothetical protein [Natronobacterium gregoryi]AFZ74768.1 hypothetical protein Natgr_3658 [Natronobacterium gregoryi SP2]ELY73561.1 hypothetical protein C490_01135 [Natronobacterium gregoryi SP2]PLK19411.1 hypothetical protein CYV19_14960 [Natronobacterium gregoryi SP2]SFJ49557.1 Superfamily I DNA or RNA helicase [Natronobacterium gregoryi]